MITAFKKKASCLLPLFVFIAIGITSYLYYFYGHQFIKAVYEGTALQCIPSIIESQDVHPVEYYYREADWLFIGMLFFCISGLMLVYTAFLRKWQLFFYGTVMSVCVYGMLFIIKASTVIDGVRYFTLVDDAMISMRYAKHVAAGYGLVWNLGDIPVEGYTNFLWTIYMALWHMLPISVAKQALPIQVTGLLCVIISLFYVKRIAFQLSGKNVYVTLASVMTMGCYLPILFWALRGMETAALGLILLASIWRVFRCVDEERFDPYLFVLLSIGLLIRIDFVVLFIAIAFFLVAAEPHNRIKNICAAGISFLIVAGAVTVFRLWYFHDILPNTYYLKMTGVSVFLRIHRGLWAAKEFICQLSLLVFFLPVIYTVMQIKKRKIGFLLYIFVVQLFYSIYVGGDMVEEWGHMANRFLCIVMPCFFILLYMMANDFFKNMAALMHRFGFAIGSGLRKCCLALFLLFMIMQMHGAFHKPYGEYVLQFLRMTGYTAEEDKHMVEIGLTLKEMTTPQATIAVVWGGAIPYFSERACIDLLGKNDLYIARQQAKVHRYSDFLPGHNKYDYDYSIKQQRPDVVQKLWWRTREEQQAIYATYIEPDYEAKSVSQRTIFFRKNSPHILQK